MMFGTMEVCQRILALEMMKRYKVYKGYKIFLFLIVV